MVLRREIGRVSSAKGMLSNVSLKKTNRLWLDQARMLPCGTQETTGRVQLLVVHTYWYLLDRYSSPQAAHNTGLPSKARSWCHTVKMLSWSQDRWHHIENSCEHWDHCGRHLKRAASSRWVVELLMIENVIGDDEAAYFVKDKVFKNFRHYVCTEEILFGNFWLEICLQTWRLESTHVW